MNVSVIPLADRAERFATKTFAAFRLTEHSGGWTGNVTWKALPLDLATEPATIEEATTAAISPLLAHKDRLAIRETDALTGETRVYLFAIKQKSRPTYVWQGHRQVAARELYAEPICVVPGEVLG